MKKFIIALVVLGTFVLYSLGIRHKLPVLNKPASVATNNSPASSLGVGGSTSTRASGNTVPPSSSSTTTAQYKDGTYAGSVTDAYYGNVKISATISGGKITAVKFLQYPDTHPTSVMINQQAMPYLQQEAIQTQSANVQVVSGATFTSQAFTQSLATALSQAQA